MPRPALRSRSLRKIKKRLPGGGFIIHYVRRKPKKAACAMCKKPLHGTPRKRPSLLKRISKTRKRPSRPYGGNLCSKCSRKCIKELKVYT